MTVWLLAIDKNHCSYEELKYRNVIAQGWPSIGDLSPLLPVKNEAKFREIIINLVSYFYEGWNDQRNPGRIMLNLVSMKPGDFVICCEGESIRGIAKISKNAEYHFQSPHLYEYAQCMCPVSEWKDIDNDNHGIKVKSMGPVGINKYCREVDIPTLFEQL